MFIRINGTETLREVESAKVGMASFVYDLQRQRPSVVVFAARSPVTGDKAHVMKNWRARSDVSVGKQELAKD